MLLIQIEQDSPEVIARARHEIASIVRRIASGHDQHSEVMLFMGYCRALSYERLISFETLDRLSHEAERAVDRLAATRG